MQDAVNLHGGFLSITVCKILNSFQQCIMQNRFFHGWWGMTISCSVGCTANTAPDDFFSAVDVPSHALVPEMLTCVLPCCWLPSVSQKMWLRPVQWTAMWWCPVIPVLHGFSGAGHPGWLRSICSWVRSFLCLQSKHTTAAEAKPFTRTNDNSLNFVVKEAITNKTLVYGNHPL